MVKSISAAWLWFLGLFAGIFILLSTGLFFRNISAYKKLQKAQDSLSYYKKLYSDLKQQYNILQSKYEITLQSAIKGSKLVAQQQQQLIKLQRVINQQDSILRNLEISVKEAVVKYLNPKAVSVKLINGRLHIIMRNKLLFPFSSAQVQPQGVIVLGQLAKVLKKNPNLNILIEGHTDNIPVKPGNKCWKDNWDLSAARAIAVARILINKYKVSPYRIEIAGKAQYDPVVPNLTPQGRALNRRIEIIVSPDLSELFKLFQK